MYNACYFLAPAGQIQAAVTAGQRPNIDDIQGPENFQVFARQCVEKCWNGEPEQRPTFGGENHRFKFVCKVNVKQSTCIAPCMVYKPL